MQDDTDLPHDLNQALKSTFALVLAGGRGRRFSRTAKGVTLITAPMLERLEAVPP